MDSDLIVLPRAAVEAAEILLRDDLLAAAKPVVDAGVWDGRLGLQGIVLRPFDDDAMSAPLGRHRALFIAADDTEEG